MRHKILRVSFELAANCMRGEHPGYRVVSGEIPKDAKMINIRHGWPDTIEILIESEEFPEVKEGEEIPLLETMFQKVMLL